ncbi:hypothetical protein B0J14DRAFT_639994 [Halenospora varia]|nr:hypothetical protein B0J14DRAFT_639994 [Halenospora varia]
MSQTGLLWVNSKITNPSDISPQNFKSWYEEEHIPDVFATKQIHSACRYQNIDPSANRPYLALYPVPDMKFLGSQQFLDIPVASKKYFSGPDVKCFDVAEFDTRFYEFVHSFEKEGVKSGPARLVISAALTPAPGTDDDFDAWYKQEHYRTLSECAGYVRTRRFKLKESLIEKNVPTYLALHEFDSESLPQEDLQKTAETPWAKKVMGSLAGSEVFVFRLTGEFGDVKAKI